MALSVDDRPLHRLSAEDVLRIAELGIFDDVRVELLDGLLVEMGAQLPEHSYPLLVLTRWLAPLIVAGTHDLREQLPLITPDPLSLPEPDLAVVVRSDGREHPREALLIVEVAVTSLRPDTTRKPQLYASAQVPDYWVVDVIGRRLQVRRDPVGGEYRALEIFGPQDTVAPLARDVAPLHLAELLRA